MPYDMIALTMFASMMLMLMTGQRVFAAIGFVSVVASLSLWGTGGGEIAFSAAMKLMGWYPLLTLPMFVFMGYILSESRLADDLYRMFHVWFGPVRGGLAIGSTPAPSRRIFSAMGTLRSSADSAGPRWGCNRQRTTM